MESAYKKANQCVRAAQESFFVLSSIQLVPVMILQSWVLHKLQITGIVLYHNSGYNK